MVIEGSATPQHSAQQNAATSLPERVYQTLLGTEQRLRKDPHKYHIREIFLGSQSPVDFSSYDGDLPLFTEVKKARDLAIGKPYIARGTMEVNDERDAVLQTENGPIHLGKIGPHAQRMFIRNLKGYEMVLPLVIDEIDATGVKAKPGERAAYLAPNPTWGIRRNLRKVDGRADFEGAVRTVDQDDEGTLTIQTKPGRNWFGKKVRELFFENGRPRYDQGTEDRPTAGELVQPDDRVKVSVDFVDGVMVLRNVTLLNFSPDHEESYTAQHQTIEQGFTLFETLLTNTELERVMTPIGKEFDVSDPDKRGAVMRYLFAELRRLQHLFTPVQHQQLWEFVARMDEDQKPVIMNNFDERSKPDPRRAQLDKYFNEQDPNAKLPILTESMTPPQLLYEMTIAAATHDNPLPLDELMGVLHDYQGQFPEEASSLLLQSVLAYREEQLRVGENALPAILTLLDAIPYLQERDGAYQADWLVHLIQAGGLLTAGNPDVWNTSADLSYFMRRCLKQLGSAVYKDENFFNADYDALFALAPYYVDHLQHWPEQLPYGLGKDPVVEHLLRDLHMIDAAGARQDIDQLLHVTEKLQHL